MLKLIGEVNEADSRARFSLVTLPEVIQHVTGGLRPAGEAVPNSEVAMEAAHLPG